MGGGGDGGFGKGGSGDPRLCKRWLRRRRWRRLRLAIQHGNNHNLWRWWRWWLDGSTLAELAAAVMTPLPLTTIRHPTGKVMGKRVTATGFQAFNVCTVPTLAQSMCHPPMSVKQAAQVQKNGGVPCQLGNGGMTRPKCRTTRMGGTRGRRGGCENEARRGHSTPIP